MRVCAIILAGGVGSRIDLGIPKQRIELLGKSLIFRATEAHEAASSITDIIVVARREDMDFVKTELSSFEKIKNIVCGGKSRAESAFNGFKAIDFKCDYIAVHDGARCLISPDDIDLVVSDAIRYGAATASAKITDTVKCLDENGFINSGLNREKMRAVQTPQVFKYSIYEKAISLIDAFDDSITDDNSIVEKIGVKIYPSDTDKNNIKITYKEDLEYAEFLLKRGGRTMCNLRIGHGYDVHRLTEGRPLVIGGVEIPHNLGLLGHSDADVLLHAIIDSIIGALALGDIGCHFPDTDEKYKGISSLALLGCVKELMDKNAAGIVNIDATVVAQKPKMLPYIKKMRENIADVLDCDVGCVNIKATTEEKLGFTGAEEGISAYSVCLIEIK